MKIFKAVTVLLFISSISFGGFKSKKVKNLYLQVQKAHKGVQEILVEDFKKNQKKMILVDVRPLKERRVSIIKGAVSKKAFEKMVLKYSEQDFVFYCTIGERSARYIETLKNRLEKNKKSKKIKAFNLEGGILGWIDSGGELVDGKGEKTKRVHVFGSRWNAVPKGYEAFWNFFNF